MHYKNKKQAQLNGVKDRDKLRYDKYHYEQHTSRDYIHEINSILSNPSSEYLLGMDSDSFLNVLQSNDELKSLIQKNVALNLLNDMSINIESSLNDNIVMNLRLELYKKKGRKKSKNKITKTFDILVDFAVYAEELNYSLIEIEGVLCKAFIDLEVLNKEFDTPNIKLVNSIISRLVILDSKEEFQNKKIGGFVWIQDTKDYKTYTKVYADDFVFKNLEINYHSFIGEIENRNKLMDNECEKNIFCECLNCNILGINQISSRNYGIYRHFGNKVISNEKFKKKFSLF